MRVWKGLWMEGKLKSINCTKLPTLPFISVSEEMSCFNHSELEIQKLQRDLLTQPELAPDHPNSQMQQ